MEKQMNEMMRIFGMNIFETPSSHFQNRENDHGYDFDHEPAPPIEGEIRDQYLKPGFHKNKAADSDLDGL